MDEFLGGCFLALVILALSALVVSLLLRQRLRRHEERLGAIEGQFENLRRQLRELRAPSGERPREAEPPPERRVEVRPPEAAREERVATPPPARPVPSEEPAAPAPGAPEPGREEPRPTPRSGPPPRPAAGPSAGAPTSAPTTGAPPSSPKPPPAAPPREPEEPRVRIDLEQWLGIRGAAVVGGILLVIAAFLLLRYSIEQGFFPPIVRVTLGLLAGIGCVVGSEVLRRRGYDTTANALAGAGIVILYGATWAGRQLYDLIPSAVAYPMMALITVACGVLAWRHRSQLIAVLGLLGGFATPLLLSTGENRPLALFGYILLLDMGLLWLARERRWPSLAGLALLGTVLYQGLWIFARMASGQLFLGLLILGVFGVLFAGAAIWLQRSREAQRAEGAEDGAGIDEETTWRATQIAGGLLPFAFVLYLATRSDLTGDLWPLALFIGLLSALAVWMSRIQDAPVLAIGAAAADLGVVLVWAARHQATDPTGGLSSGLTDGQTWQVVATAVGLTAIFHVLFELERRKADDDEGPSLPRTFAAALAAVGFSVLLLVLLGVWNRDGFAVWLTGAVLLASFVWRQGALSPPGARSVWAAMAPSLGICLFYADREAAASVVPYLSTAIGWGVLFHAWSLWRRSRRSGRWTDDLAAAAPSLLLLVTLALEALGTALGGSIGAAYSLLGFPAAALLLAFLTVLAATRLRSGVLYFVTLLFLLIAQAFWADGATAGEALPLLALLGGSAVFFTGWPLLVGRGMLSSRWAVYAAALAGPLWFLVLHYLWTRAWGDDAIGLLPVLLGVVALGAALFARRAGLAPEDRLRTQVWFSAVALSFVALAIPLQLDQEWVTIGWALQAAALLALWQRLDHPGLKWFALLLAAVTTVRLVANPAVLGYHATHGIPVFNWLMYTYLVPAAALLVCVRILNELEVARHWKWERGFYMTRNPVGAIACGAAAILVVFVWINLTVFDAFGTGFSTTQAWQRRPARDLTLSLTWILYAVVLMAIGFRQRIKALRWTGLGFLLLTLCKIFLYDLGELKGLYRVFSFLGLGLALIGVSLAYRFLQMREERQLHEEGGDDG